MRAVERQTTQPDGHRRRSPVAAIKRAVLVALVNLVYGRRRWETLFAALHRVTLVGLGYGNDNAATNGEVALLRRLAATWPTRPIVVDAGANIGEWTSAVLDAAPGAAVYSLEPAAGPYGQLVQRVGTRAQTFPVGLSSEPRTVTLWGPPEYPGMASVHKRDLRHLNMTIEAVAEVSLTTLDLFCAEHCIAHIHLLKMDVEGHELDVLTGASQLLASGAVDAIQFEFGGANIDSRTYVRDFRDRLEPLGYRLHRILRDGLATAFRGDERAEIFTYCNFIAVREP